jgi:hypothetical protein
MDTQLYSVDFVHNTTRAEKGVKARKSMSNLAICRHSLQSRNSQRNNASDIILMRLNSDIYEKRLYNEKKN